MSENDLVVLDFGGVYRSYCSDLTRTVVLGPASARAREVHAAVLEAHDFAIQAVSPGRSRFAIDAAARDALTARGLGEAFGHGTGHGLGIDIHEDPKVTRRTGVETARPDEEQVDAGMVFDRTSAYLPGWGGVQWRTTCLSRAQRGSAHQRDDGPARAADLDDVGESRADAQGGSLNSK